MKKIIYIPAGIETIKVDIDKLLRATNLISGVDKISAAWEGFTINGEKCEYELVCENERIIINKINSVKDLCDFEEKMRVFILRGEDEVFADARRRLGEINKPVILLEEHVERKKELPKIKADVMPVEAEQADLKWRSIVRKGQVVAWIMLVLIILGCLMLAVGVVFEMWRRGLLWM